MIRAALRQVGGGIAALLLVLVSALVIVLACWCEAMSEDRPKRRKQAWTR